jgi:hypothetical protein
MAHDALAGLADRAAARGELLAQPGTALLRLPAILVRERTLVGVPPPMPRTNTWWTRWSSPHGVLVRAARSGRAARSATAVRLCDAAPGCGTAAITRA